MFINIRDKNILYREDSSNKEDKYLRNRIRHNLIPELKSMQDGSFIITTTVSPTTPAGQKMILNGYVNYSVPTVVKAGVPLKGEVTAYTLSVAGVASDQNINTNQNPNQNNINNNPNNSPTTNNLPSRMSTWLPSNFLEWIIALLALGVFIAAVRYVITAFRGY